ncbi:DUF4126 domain-containing protein [Stutzerimonas stutzeri]|uniref:DUF4126 domain-containing protein n=1 Tax=Stutzerimonas stutzeri TaxID=316 RepID=A0A6I6LE76_STUST|nr:DUF4126 domain-containing protein [Stutzerimonas stutzeri]QGZ29219.1 DUF4126 domain-containing protein [Stutzerimonas stutzeri]
MTLSSNLFWGALALGVVTGMRSMLAPTMVSRALAVRDDRDHLDEPARTLGLRRARQFLVPLAASELLGDKLPFAPDRTIPPSMLVRALSGAVSAAALANARRESVWLPALIGASAACVSAKIGLDLRKRYGSAGGMRNAALGLTEDALALAIGTAGLKRTLDPARSRR